MKHLSIVILLVILFSSLLTAQWIRTNGPEGGIIGSFAVNGANLYAGSIGAGVFRSSNNGIYWTQVNDGLNNVECQVTALEASGQLLLLSWTYSGEFGVCLSTNEGTTWTEVNNGLSAYVYCFAFHGTDLFSGTNGNGIYLSTDYGASWSAVNNGLTNLNVLSLAVNEDKIYAGTNGGGMYLSTNSGSLWTQINNGLSNLSVMSIIFNGTNLYAGTNGGGVFLSTDNGSNWSAVNNGLTNLSISKIVAADDNLFAKTDGGIFHSTNSGASWTQVNSSFTSQEIMTLVATSGYLFAGTYREGIFRSTDSGSNWTQMNWGVNQTWVHAIALKENNIFAGTFSGGIYLTTDNGTKWTLVKTGSVNALLVNGEYIYAGTWGDGVGLFLSTDNGTTWTAANNGITSASVNALSSKDNYIYAGTDGSGVFRSTNNGISWSPSNTGLTGNKVWTFAISGDNIFAGTLNGGVFLSTNNGENWSAVNNGLTDLSVWTLVMRGTYLFAGTDGSGIFLSTNYGNSWTSVNNGLTGYRMRAIAVSGNNVFAGTDADGGIFLSTDNGSNWAPINDGLILNSAWAFAVNSTDLFAGIWGGGVWRLPLQVDSNLFAYYPFNGNANDESGNGNDGTVAGAVLIKDRFLIDSAAYRFDGNSYIDIPELFQADQVAFTLSAWVTVDSLTPIDQCIFYKGSVQGEMGMGTQGFDSLIGFGVKLADNIWYQLDAPEIPELNRYYHILARYQRGDVIDLWVDGVKVDSLIIPDFDLKVNSPGTTSSIGAVYGGIANYWRGTIDEIRVYNRVLSEEEIKELYSQNPSARINHIVDIPNDQGGKVRVQWHKSILDTMGAQRQITSYGVWRKIPPELRSKKIVNAVYPMNDTLGVLYDFITSVPAVQSPEYNVVTQTLDDSSASGDHYFTFLITAHTDDPNIFYISPVDSGYSVDNLKPSTVTGLYAVVQEDSEVKLSWDINEIDPDIGGYVIYRSLESGFIPTPSFRIGTSVSGEYTDSSPLHGYINYYRVTTVDIHDNESMPSSEVSTRINVSLSLNVKGQWNMVALPLTVTDHRKITLYPSAISDAFSYSGSYQPRDTITTGYGYWLKFHVDETINIKGFPVNNDTVNVMIGWNMIGSLYTTIGVNSIESVPGGLVTSSFFGYENGNYIEIDSLRAGKGYWVKSASEGKLILTTQNDSVARSKIIIKPIAEMPPLPPDNRLAQVEELPKEFQLYQNYPNPFNPLTTINYALPESRHVRLVILNMLGQVVGTLVDQEQNAGYKSITFDASDLPSGIYYYRIMVGDFIQTKKMTLIR